MVPTKMVRSRVWRASAFTLWSTFSWNAVAQTASFNEFTIPTPAVAKIAPEAEGMPADCMMIGA